MVEIICFSDLILIFLTFQDENLYRESLIRPAFAEQSADVADAKIDKDNSEEATVRRLNNVVRVLDMFLALVEKAKSAPEANDGDGKGRIPSIRDEQLAAVAMKLFEKM